ncbi:hypothetical protein, partial [Klebsiella pneumoniae]
RLGCQKACVLPENPASYRVVRTKSYLFNKARHYLKDAVVANGEQVKAITNWFELQHHANKCYVITLLKWHIQ